VPCNGQADHRSWTHGSPPPFPPFKPYNTRCRSHERGRHISMKVVCSYSDYCTLHCDRRQYQRVMTKQQQSLPRVSAASYSPTDLSTHTQGTCRPLSNLSTTTNDSRSLCRNAQQNTPPRHPQAFGLSAMKKDMLRRKIKGCCRRRAGTRCLGRISSQTAWAKVAQEREASNAGTTAHRTRILERRIIQHRIRYRNQRNHLLRIGSAAH
jgi:hypothetical protein